MQESQACQMALNHIRLSGTLDWLDVCGGKSLAIRAGAAAATIPFSFVCVAVTTAKRRQKPRIAA